MSKYLPPLSGSYSTGFLKLMKEDLFHFQADIKSLSMHIPDQYILAKGK